MAGVTNEAVRVAGVELGGTKCIAVVGEGLDIMSRRQWRTGDDPARTLAEVSAWLDHHHALYGFAALGIASFGPVCLDRASANYGFILDTPKPGWSGVDVVNMLRGKRDMAVGFDTDVAGAALAEGRWGAAVGCAAYVYLTIGTGIGGGVVVDGKPLHGALHPEIGHIRVRRAPSDDFPGACPFHHDCLEGLASGPAIALRAGRTAETLDEKDPIWGRVADELGELMHMLILTLSPQRIVVGGGLGLGQAHLLPRILIATEQRLGNYLPGQSLAELKQTIVHASLGDNAGVHGALVLALHALGRRES